MTCLEKYFKEHPGDHIVGCPHDYGYLEKPENCFSYKMSCFKDCWTREIKNNSDNSDGGGHEQD